jgi:hypothetical protein
MSAPARPRRVPALVIAVIAGGCDGESIARPYDEPLVVNGGQFFEGSLPGAPPLTADEIVAGVAPTPPLVTSYEFAGRNVRPGELGKSLRGRTSGDALSVAFAFAEQGSGYWIRPLGGPDVAFPGELAWAADVDFGHQLRPGLHELLFAAIDASGHAGTQVSARLCVTSPVPDNSNACDPTVAPPNTVLSLEWDSDVDLDLELVTPEGKRVSAKSPTSALTEEGEVDPDGAAARLDRDAGLG